MHRNRTIRTFGLRAAELNPVGGGGTSFRVVFEWLATLPELPRALIMITDGECSDFGDEPAVPVLWILTESNPRRARTATA
ncbi:VWA-like domain-containing protein [Longimicrobium sp.]|uniref:VWA-like domain-containing protein n=1 Tax=Longimicrobium sp. TaxID=2029185 RepID=UPI003B3B5FD7